MNTEHVADALRLIRTTHGLTQTAASKLNGAPDFRTLSHWETKRKAPSIRLLLRYLAAFGLDLHDLQDALDAVSGESCSTARRLDELDRRVDRLARICEDLSERRQVVLEGRSMKAEALQAQFASELAGLGERIALLEHSVVATDVSG